MIGFLLCSTEGPHVDFVNPINPIEKLEGADKHTRKLRFYNSEVNIWAIYRVHSFNFFFGLNFAAKYLAFECEYWNTYTLERSYDSFLMQMHSAAFALPAFLKSEVRLLRDYSR